MTSPSETENATAPATKTDKPAETPTTPAAAASPTSDAAATATTTTTTTASANNKPTVHKTDYEKDVVYLYQFTRCPTLPGISPFCLKVETWLRMNQVKYEVSCFLSYRRALPFKFAHRSRRVVSSGPVWQ